MKLLRKIFSLTEQPDFLVVVGYCFYCLWLAWLLMSLVGYFGGFSAALVGNFPRLLTFWKEIGLALAIGGYISWCLGLLFLEHRRMPLARCEFERIPQGAAEQLETCLTNLKIRIFRGRTPEREQMFFRQNFFSLLGILSNIDGRLSALETSYVQEKICARFELVGPHREQALALFEQGRVSELSLQEIAANLATYFRRSPQILRTMLDLLTGLAESDGALHSTERVGLEEIARLFEMDLRYRAGSTIVKQQEPPDPVAGALRVLGLSAGASDREVDTAFRRYALEYHPDRLVIQGLPLEFSKQAAEKFMEVRQAYQELRVRRAKGVSG